MFIETRGNDNKKAKEVTFSYAILNPSASFGGLYVPKSLPKIDIEEIKDLSYKELALLVLKKFDVDIDTKILEEAINLYDNFDNQNAIEISKINNNLFVNELYHGPTRAFKDMALQPFGYILSYLAKQQNQNYLILAATSGDTGPAALESFKDKENIKIVCLYPDGGTSDVQKLQMVTQNGKNQKVLGIKGNFDDAQNSLKSLLADNDFNNFLKEKNYKLSAANSVNFGRIIFQIIYHLYSYIHLLKNNEISSNEKIDIIIPSGNFGNALGAYYAKKMSNLIENIYIASNENNILTEFINEGSYDLRNKKLINTKSPAMDILKSSNIERILFDLFKEERTKELMDDLATKKYFKLTKEEKEKLQKEFFATYSDDKYATTKIKEYIDKYNYLFDPHTATCIKAYEKFNPSNKTIICSTAEWTKFSPTILNSINNDNEKYSDTFALEEVSKKLNIKIPSIIEELFKKDIIHKDIIEIDNIKDSIKKFL